jgi:hypothetical protein
MLTGKVKNPEDKMQQYETEAFDNHVFGIHQVLWLEWSRR